jgi:hypothetical protein
VQGTTGNGTEYIRAGSIILSPSQIAQDGINVFMANTSTGNPFVGYQNGTAVSAINTKGEFFSQPTDTGTTEFQGNGPLGQTAPLQDEKIAGVSKWTVDPTGTVTAGSLKWVWLGGTNATLSNSATSYFLVNGLSPAASVATNGNVMTIASGSYVAANLHCVLMTSGGVVTALGANTSYVLTFNKNASATAQTCTVSGGQSTCSDTTAGDAVSIAANDILYYTSAIGSGTPTALEAKCAVEVHG